MRPYKLVLFSILAFATLGCAQDSATTFTVENIWDCNYSAFPSICEFKGQYYVSFREGESHIFDRNGIAAGQTRILRSCDGKEWEPVALLTKESYDLRDPKLSVTPDGKLMVTMGGSRYVDKVLEACVPHVSFSEDGKTFTEPEPVIYPDATDSEWFWRVTWNEGTGYAVTYHKLDNEKFALVKTKDGKNYETVHKFDNIGGFPNETTVRFLPDGRMALLIRREKEDAMAYWATSTAPYTEWTIKALNFRIGGPDFIVTGDNEVIAGGRSYVQGERLTYIWEGDFDGNFNSRFILPSGGDNSYPGFLTVGDELWTVYYSSHQLKDEEGKARAGIYLAKIPIDYFSKF